MLKRTLGELIFKVIPPKKILRKVLTRLKMPFRFKTAIQIKIFDKLTAAPLATKKTTQKSKIFDKLTAAPPGDQKNNSKIKTFRTAIVKLYRSQKAMSSLA